jgi:hypothetical protein
VHYSISLKDGGYDYRPAPRGGGGQLNITPKVHFYFVWRKYSKLRRKDIQLNINAKNCNYFKEILFFLLNIVDGLVKTRL